jgi:hypothetical protein
MTIETTSSVSWRTTARTSRPRGAWPPEQATSVARTDTVRDCGSGRTAGSSLNRALPQPSASSSIRHWPHPLGAHCPSRSSRAAYAYVGSPAPGSLGSPKSTRSLAEWSVRNHVYGSTNSSKNGASPPRLARLTSLQDANGTKLDVSGGRSGNRTPPHEANTIGSDGSPAHAAASSRGPLVRDA